MSKHVEAVVAVEHEAGGRNSLASYVVGFVLSVFLTLCAYFVVTRGLLHGRVALAAISIFAVLQFVVQLLCFLHLGRETKPRWKLAVFWFMILTVFIVVVGSIWIMNNLNYHTMPTDELPSHLHTEEGL
jgi:cytochrome o ubiquinol oxidase operon protein cyoD